MTMMMMNLNTENTLGEKQMLDDSTIRFQDKCIFSNRKKNAVTKKPVKTLKNISSSF